jgi:ubiquinone biosynthesis protein
LDIIQKIVKLVAKFLKIKGIEHLYQQIEQMIEEELNYLQEAQSMQIIKKNLAKNPLFFIPKVYEKYTTKKVLVIEYCEGVKISNKEQLEKWGIELEPLADGLVHGFCQMILEDGFYHADPHPGNVLVNKEGQIILLDFGAVAQLSTEMKEGIPQLIDCMIKQDAEQMVKILRKLGFLAKGDDAAKIAETLIDNVQDFVHNDLQLQNLNIQNITPAQFKKALGLINLKEMTKIMQIPKDWVLLNRAIVLVSGVAMVLVPEWNPLPTLQPYLQKQLLNQQGGLAQIVVNAVKNQLNAAVTIPLELQKTLRKVNKGKLEVEIKGLDNSLKSIRNVVQQITWLLLFSISVYFYVSLHEVVYPKLHLLFECTGVIAFVCFWWNVWKK